MVRQGNNDNKVGTGDGRDAVLSRPVGPGRIFETRPPDRYLVHGGEALFKSRGHPGTAAVVSAPLGGACSGDPAAA